MLSGWFLLSFACNLLSSELILSQPNTLYCLTYCKHDNLKTRQCRVFLYLKNGKILITKRLRRIPNARHSQFDSALVFTAQWFR